MSLPLRGAWIETDDMCRRRYTWKSLPLRGAWIETSRNKYIRSQPEVAPLAGGVD